MAPPSITCVDPTSCLSDDLPTPLMFEPEPIDTSGGVHVAAAAAGAGIGTYLFAPGSVDDVAGHELGVSLPSTSFATTYSASIIISLIAGP